MRKLSLIRLHNNSFHLSNLLKAKSFTLTINVSVNTMKYTWAGPMEWWLIPNICILLRAYRHLSRNSNQKWWLGKLSIKLSRSIRFVTEQHEQHGVTSWPSAWECWVWPQVKWDKVGFVKKSNLKLKERLIKNLSLIFNFHMIKPSKSLLQNHHHNH